MELRRVGDVEWEIPRRDAMHVPGRIWASEAMMRALRDDPALAQVRNVAHLPGIVRASMAMPDVHWGYGFPIGGVAAVDADDGVVSPGGIGFDINCGVRLLRTRLDVHAVRDDVPRIADRLYAAIPAGVGNTGGLRLSPADQRRVLARGAAWAVDQGFGRASDLERMEEGGCMRTADPAAVSEIALTRGRPQLGTLGSGNHFLELQVVDAVLDADGAEALGLALDQVTLMIHSGSRGLGHQVCDEAVRAMGPAMARHGITVPDRQLACVPIRSGEGRAYLAAMAAAANFAWANRQVMTGLAERALSDALGIGADALGSALVWDVCHNVASFEEHDVDGRPRRLCIHRKGATRALPAGHARLPATLRAVGQPVVLPGDMGRHSYLLLGAAGSADTFHTACHGAGRLMSRSQAKQHGRGIDLVANLRERGVTVRARSLAGIAEEMPWAYKDVTDVVDVIARAGLARPVVRLRPLAVVKG